MGDRVNAHCKSLQTVDWSAHRDGVNDYMVLLVKETVTLHKVLSRYLQDTVLEYIMSQVFASVSHRLTEEYSKIELPSQEAKDRMLRDAKYLHQHLSGLKNVNPPTGMLETVIGEKRVPGAQNVPARSPTPSVPSPNPASASLSSPPSQHTNHLESTNERLKGLFRRSSMFVSSEPKEKLAPSTPPTPRTEKPPIQHSERPLSPPPPPPEKQNLAASSSPPPPSSTPPVDGRNSPLPIEKELPDPGADSTLETSASVERASHTLSAVGSQDSVDSQGVKPVEESAIPNGNGHHSEATPEVSAT